MPQILVTWISKCLNAGVVILLIQVSYGRCQFPRPCTTLKAISSHECCPPMRVGGSNCGEAEGRGTCSDIIIKDSPHSQQYVLVGVDDRERWPERFFNRSCLCNGNYGGYDCSECKFGWQGNDCLERSALTIRQNILNMTEQKRTAFLEVLAESKTTIHPDYVIARDHYRNLMGENGTEQPNFVNISIYDLFVWQHYYSVRDTLLGPGQTYTAIDFSHEGPGFLTWHRMHLMGLEADLQKLLSDPTFALPYWDFATGGSECDICTDELLGGRDPVDHTLLTPGSRFADWNVICLNLDWFNDNVKLCNGTFEGPIRRNPGGNIDRPTVQNLPIPDDVDQCLTVDAYDTTPFFSNSAGSFRNALEGYSKANGEFETGVRTLHNLAHLFLNGTGGITHASTNDPIFVLLHAFTDAIFEEWLTRFNATVNEYPTENAPIGHNLDYNMVPFFPPVKNRDMFVFSQQLGYSYSIQLPGIQASGAGPSFLWAIGAVALLVVVTACVLVAVNSIKRCKQRRRNESLYQSLIADGVDKDIHYAA